MVKNPLQNTSFKVQVSISNAPEGSDTVRVRLTAGAEATIAKALAASIRSINLRRRPIEGAGETVPSGSTDVAWIV
jgi:hypothetical protein